MTPPELLTRLPPDIADRLRDLGAAATTILGHRRPIQWIVDRHLDLFDLLLGHGLDYTAIADLLSAVDVTTADGGRLPTGTLSSAVYRARLRAGHPPPAMVARGGTVPHCSAPHPAAADCSAPPPDAARRTAMPSLFPLPTGSPGDTPDRRVVGATAASGLLPIAAPNRRAAELLNRLTGESKK